MGAARYSARHGLGVLAVGLLATISPLAGCGRSDPDRPEASDSGIRGAEQAVKNYLHAFHKGQSEAACGALSDTYRTELVKRNAKLSRQLGATTCPEFVQKLHARAEQSGGITFEGEPLDSVRITNLPLKTNLRSDVGESQDESATIKGPKGRQVFELERSNDRWTITSIR